MICINSQGAAKIPRNVLEITEQKTASKVRLSLFAGTVPENRENGWGVKNIYSIRPTNIEANKCFSNPRVPLFTGATKIKAL